MKMLWASTAIAGLLTGCAAATPAGDGEGAGSPVRDVAGCRQVQEALTPVRAGLAVTVLPPSFAATADMAVSALTGITSGSEQLRSALGFVAIDLTQISAQIKAKGKTVAPVAALRKDLSAVDAACPA